MNKIVELRTFVANLNKGIVLEDGINWSFADGFVSKEDADQFVTKCNELGIESGEPVCSNKYGIYHVRFR